MVEQERMKVVPFGELVDLLRVHPGFDGEKAGEYQWKIERGILSADHGSLETDELSVYFSPWNNADVAHIFVRGVSEYPKEEEFAVWKKVIEGISNLYDVEYGSHNPIHVPAEHCFHQPKNHQNGYELLERQDLKDVIGKVWLAEKEMRSCIDRTAFQILNGGVRRDPYSVPR